MYNPLSKVFRFHETILSFGDWIPTSEERRQLKGTREVRAEVSMDSRPHWQSFFTVMVYQSLTRNK